MTTKKKPSPTDEKSSALASRAKQDADGATLAGILAVLERIDAKLAVLMPKPLEKL